LGEKREGGGWGILPSLPQSTSDTKLTLVGGGSEGNSTGGRKERKSCCSLRKPKEWKKDRIKKKKEIEKWVKRLRQLRGGKREGGTGGLNLFCE